MALLYFVLMALLVLVWCYALIRFAILLLRLVLALLALPGRWAYSRRKVTSEYIVTVRDYTQD